MRKGRNERLLINQYFASFACFLFAHFAVNSFNRKERKGCARGARDCGSFSIQPSIFIIT